MSTFIEDDLTAGTGITAPERARLLRWLARLPEEEICRLLGEAFDSVSSDARTTDPGRGLFCALIAVGRLSGWDTLKGRGFRVAGEEQFDAFDRDLSLRAGEAVRRKRRKGSVREKVLAFWCMVSTLRGEGASFQTIAEQLWNWHRVKVSWMYLSLLWRERQTRGRGKDD